MKGMGAETDRVGSTKIVFTTDGVKKDGFHNRQGGLKGTFQRQQGQDERYIGEKINLKDLGRESNRIRLIKIIFPTIDGSKKMFFTTDGSK